MRQPLRVADLPDPERRAVEPKVIEYMNRAEMLKPYVKPASLPVAAAGVPSPIVPARGTPRIVPKGSTPRTASGGLPVAVAPPAAALNPETAAMEAEILEEVLDTRTGVSWDSIAGLEFAKEQLVC